MSSVLYLGENDFYVDKGQKGPIICCSQKGISFVMFHANPNVCQFCDLAKPEFMQLPQIISGAKFYLCNLSNASGLVQKSFNTIMPLNKVPLFILFVEGRPFMNYNGEKQLKHFSQFMQDAMKLLQQKQVFSANGVNITSEASEKTPHGLPYDFDYDTVSTSYLVGNLTCTEDGVCYLTNKEALGGQEKPKPKETYQPPPQPQYQPPPQQQPQYVPQQQQQPQFYQAQPQPYYPPPTSQRLNTTVAQQQYPMYGQQAQQYAPQQQYQQYAPQQAQYQQQYQPQPQYYSQQPQYRY
jgi:hypothetical protein